MFDFSGWGTGTVTVISVDALDIEHFQTDARVEVFSNANPHIPLGVIPIPPQGNNGSSTLSVGVSDVNFMIVTLDGSGAIDNVRLIAQVSKE